MGLTHGRAVGGVHECFMKKLKSFLYRDIGIIVCILFYICFLMIANAQRPYLHGADWYIASSIQRTIFGVVELMIFVKLFRKEKWTNVINFTHFKDGLRAGSGLILYTIVITVVTLMGLGSIINTTPAILFSCLICQQVTTGFWEELTFRAFVLEGYANKEKKNWQCRMAYACISFLIFGLLHAIERDNIVDAVDIFFLTGVFGFAFAAVYLHSHNILAPMLLHFIYDIPANLQQFVATWKEDKRLFVVLNNYVGPSAFLLMLIISVVFVVKEPVPERTFAG